jgi:hypothetical protein
MHAFFVNWQAEKSIKTLNRMKVFRLIIWTQATYILITAVWPLVHIESFMEVTGYKTDVWLVKTVGALLIPIAACLYTYLLIDTRRLPAIVLGSLTAVAFMTIDFYYALTDVISDIYLADGAVELVFFVAWIVHAFSTNRNASGH